MKGYVIWAFAHPAHQLPYPISLWIRNKESDSFSLSLHFLQVKRFLFPHMLQSAETRKKEQDPSHSISPFSTAQFQFF
jgi:hypothetical protein